MIKITPVYNLDDVGLLSKYKTVVGVQVAELRGSLKFGLAIPMLYGGKTYASGKKSQVALHNFFARPGPLFDIEQILIGEIYEDELGFCKGLIGQTKDSRKILPVSLREYTAADSEIILNRLTRREL